MNATNQTQAFTHKHPRGGRVSGVASPNGLSVAVTDTRRINGVRRSVCGVVFNRGGLGWSVVRNPGVNPIDLGTFKTATAAAAWELTTVGGGR